MNRIKRWLLPAFACLCFFISNYSHGADNYSIRAARKTLESVNSATVRDAFVTLASDGIIEDLPQMMSYIKKQEILGLLEKPGTKPVDNDFALLLRDVARTKTLLAEKFILAILLDKTLVGLAGDTQSPEYDRRKAVVQAMGYTSAISHQTIPLLQRGIHNNGLGIDYTIPLESLTKIGTSEAANAIEEEFFKDSEHFPGSSTKHIIITIAASRDRLAMFELLIKILEKATSKSNRLLVLSALTINQWSSGDSHSPVEELPLFDTMSPPIKKEMQHILEKTQYKPADEEEKKMFAKLRSLFTDP